MESRKEFLEKEIKRHNLLYWKEGIPEISDFEYDKLLRELEEIDPSNPLISEIHTPEVSVDSKLIEKKVKHKFPMRSLKKVYSVEDLIKWCEKVARSEDEVFTIQLKYDGCSAELWVGVLSTRGNGYWGENITDKLQIMNVVTSKSDYYFYLRGEIVVKKSDFRDKPHIYVAKDGTPYKTEQNAAAGLLNRDDILPSIGTVLTLVDFDNITISRTIKELKTDNWNTLVKPLLELDYPADGFVIKLQDKEYEESLGITDHHPKGQMSLKFSNPTGETVLEDVVWSAGKIKLTPIGKVWPVEVGGVIIQNVNLHNYKYILDNNIHIGDFLVVERAGGVIPDVQEVNPGEIRTTINILHCPVCGKEVEYKEPEIVCTNQNCEGKEMAKLLDSVTRIGIERLGEPTLRKMVNTLGVVDLVDIFNLTKENILELEGFAEESTNNLYNEIQTVKQIGVYEWQILSVLNLYGIGRTLSKSLLEVVSLNKLRSMSTSELEVMKGFGKERARVLHYGLLISSNYIDTLLKILPIREVAVQESPLYGKEIALTGAGDRPRPMIIEMIESRGGTVKSVSKTTDILVAADPNSGTEKTKKAREYGTQVISYQELMDIMTD